MGEQASIFLPAGRQKIKTPASPRQDRRIKTKRKTNFKQVFS
jgi:hypothetical protein